MLCPAIDMLTQMHNRLEPRLATLPTFALIAILSLTAHGQSPSPGSGAANTSDALLPRKVVVPVSVVNRFFPELTREAGSGQNLTAVGKPKATRSVIYANTDSSKKVTVTVDQYMTSDDASAAYHEAVKKSKAVPGFKPIAENVNENVFIGTVSQGRETHIGLGALKDTLVVGATLVGYEPAPETTAKLVLLTGEEETAAKAALGSNAH